VGRTRYRVVSKGDDVVTYESTTPSFSVFAVGEHAASETTEPTESTSVDANLDDADPTEDDTLLTTWLVVALLGAMVALVLVARQRRRTE